MVGDFVASRGPDEHWDELAEDGFVVRVRTDVDDETGEVFDQYLVLGNHRGRVRWRWWRADEVRQVTPGNVLGRHAAVRLVIDDLYRSKPKRRVRLEQREIDLLGWAHELAVMT